MCSFNFQVFDPSSTRSASKTCLLQIKSQHNGKRFAWSKKRRELQKVNRVKYSYVTNKQQRRKGKQVDPEFHLYPCPSTIYRCSAKPRLYFTWMQKKRIRVVKLIYMKRGNTNFQCKWTINFKKDSGWIFTCIEAVTGACTLHFFV